MFLYNFVKKHHITKRLFISYFTGLCIILYFLFYAILGPKGLLTYYSLEKQIAQEEVVKEALSSKVQVKKNMVKGMSSHSLDIDLLDEQARKTLGYAGKNEVVIYQEEAQESEKSESTTNEKQQ